MIGKSQRELPEVWQASKGVFPEGALDLEVAAVCEFLAPKTLRDSPLRSVSTWQIVATLA